MNKFPHLPADTSPFPARILITGRNSQIPKLVRLPVGVGVDGCTISAPIYVKASESICPACQGHGDIHCSSNNPSVRDWTERCECCNGRGIISTDEEESE